MDLSRQIFLYWVIISLILPISGISAESPFPASSISSGFGPRIHPAKTIWNFHNGVDYAQIKGTPIQAVDEGTLDKIKYEDKSGWVIGIQSQSGYWSYLHTFQNGSENLPQPITVGKCSLRKDKNGIYIDNDGMAIRLYDHVEIGTFIAPVGNSGEGTGSHLHLNLNNGKNNALSQFSDIPSSYKVVMQKPQDGEEIDSGDLSKDYDVRFNVDSAQGKNMDSITAYLDGKQQGNSKYSFCYGGIPGETQINMNPSNNISCGVNPVKGTFKNDFVLPCDFSGLNEGQHEIMIKTRDVKLNPHVNKFKFTVKRKSNGYIVFKITEKYHHHEGWEKISEVSLTGGKDTPIVLPLNAERVTIYKVVISTVLSVGDTGLAGKVIVSGKRTDTGNGRMNAEYAEKKCSANLTISDDKKSLNVNLNDMPDNYNEFFKIFPSTIKIERADKDSIILKLMTAHRTLEHEITAETEGIINKCEGEGQKQYISNYQQAAGDAKSDLAKKTFKEMEARMGWDALINAINGKKQL